MHFDNFSNDQILHNCMYFNFIKKLLCNKEILVDCIIYVVPSSLPNTRRRNICELEDTCLHQVCSERSFV